MWKLASGMLGATVLAVLLANYMLNRSTINPIAGDQTSVAATQTPQQVKTVPKTAESYAGRSTRIKGDRRGHFVTDAKMNGRRIQVLVDTGATSVAINKSIARKLGIRLSQSDFKYTVNTANGTVKVANALIDRIQIGRVTVENVQAAVLPDRSLNDVLLGMSFLGQLRSFKVESGELVLTQ